MEAIQGNEAIFSELALKIGDMVEITTKETLENGCLAPVRAIVCSECSSDGSRLLVGVDIGKAIGFLELNRNNVVHISKRKDGPDRLASARFNDTNPEKPLDPNQEPEPYDPNALGCLVGVLTSISDNARKAICFILDCLGNLYCLIVKMDLDASLHVCSGDSFQDIDLYPIVSSFRYIEGEVLETSRVLELNEVQSLIREGGWCAQMPIPKMIW